MSTFITDYSSYCWTVQNFRLFDSIGTYHTSPIFRLCDRDWTLRLYPCGKRDRKYVGVYLENIGSMGIIVDWKIDVLDAKQERVGGYTACNCRYIPKQSNAGTAQLISRKNALDALENGHLHLKCSIRLTNEQAVLSSNSTYEDAVNLDLSKIYSGLLDSGLFSDFTIKVQGQTFKAHRAILATQSSYFKNMLSHQMTEAAEQSVTMDDVDPEIFRYLLYFLYTGQCGNKETKTEGDKKEEALYCQLLMAADRFGVGRLATVCVDRLCSIVTAQNAAEMLVFAERLNHLILKVGLFFTH